MSWHEGHTVGKIGEDIAVRYLTGKGFTVLDRNFRTKWGELDIVAEKEGYLHIVEVKTASTKTTITEHIVFPEEHMTPAKINRLEKALQIYLSQKGKEDEVWQLDLVTIILILPTKEASVAYLPHIY